MTFKRQFFYDLYHFVPYLSQGNHHRALSPCEMKRILFNKRFVVDPTNLERRRESRVSSIEKSGSLKLAIFKVSPAIGFGLGKVTGPFSCKTTFSSMRLDLVLLNRTGGIRVAFQASESFENETPYYIAKQGRN